ncbi:MULTISPECIES: DUF2897 family protein [Photobacterium]|uniref:Succinyl-diaminopimelate desuccinylase n=1 Tax=Photobacterium ganghwense TaxID=320778 RepID=A0A0J1HHG0_9GAMM|nr:MULTISPECIES: DUF2897 family protein [Photobacterium]KLV11061.1 succinyl-diaminopimelate desuccinylase [Photobacterium ganghwense]PSU11326.1 DUF2897 domain-containing protein [Photobacterium ganghwense]QSV13451.1 DUF2897 family protein [Photobacterium ganghwense]
MEWLLNPWVITLIIVSVLVSNIAALKYTANMKFDYKDKVKYMQEKHQREQAQNNAEQDPNVADQATAQEQQTEQHKNP